MEVGEGNADLNWEMTCEVREFTLRLERLANFTENRGVF